MARRSRRPYWAVAVLIALMVAPKPLFTLGVIALAALPIARRIARAAAVRRQRADKDMGPGSVVLGHDRQGRHVVLSSRQLSAHALILGASGAGKSTSLLRILTARVEQGMPVVAIDLKGSPSFASTLAGAAARAGRPFLAWTPDGPAHWNPLARGNPTQLKDKLISTERFSEPHYQRAAERYLQTVLTVLEARDPRRRPTLEDVVNLCEPQRLAGLLRGLEAPLRTHVGEYLATLGRDQLSAIRGLGTRLAILTESHTGRYLNAAPDVPGQTIDLRAALDGEAVVLFSLNSSTYGKLSAQLGTMVVQDLVAATGARLERDPAASGPQALVGIDEFSALGADHVVNLFAKGREAGVSVVVATQELADLDRAGAGVQDQILGNTTLKIIHRQDVPASSRMAAALAGTEWCWEETRQFGGSPLRNGFGPRGSMRQVERYVVDPNEIASLLPGETLVIAKLPAPSVTVVRVTPPTAPVAAPATVHQPARTVAGASDRPSPSRSLPAVRSLPRAGSADAGAERPTPPRGVRGSTRSGGQREGPER